MGSWSVYCGISQIAITSGHECVLLPLKKNNTHEYYNIHLPATLPIYGEYDDYGGLENIVEDKNTKLIEEHFNCTIEEFCNFFTRGCVRDDEDDFPIKLKELEEIKGWTFMFIDKKVYDFMSTHTGYDAGFFPMGNPNLLKFFGFIKEDEESGDERYKEVWKYNDFVVWSDGTWCNIKTPKVKGSRDSLFSIDGGYSSLSKQIELNENMISLKNKFAWQAWRIFDDEKRAEYLNGIIGGRRDDTGMKVKFLSRLRETLLKNGETEESVEKTISELAHPKPLTIVDKYISNLEDFGDTLAELITIRYNFNPMSGDFKPYTLYLTPQCGEFDEHQKLLEEFSKINKTYIYNEDDEE